MASVSNEAKRRRIEGDNEDIYRELFGGEDSDEEFEGFEIESDDEEGFREIDSEGWVAGCKRDPKPLIEFEESLSGLRSEGLPENPTYLDFYKLFLPDEVFDTIASETNR